MCDLRWLGLTLVLLLLAVGCAPQPPANRSGLQAVTAIPTLDMDDPTALCRAVSQYWGQDWPLTIQALEGLRALDHACDGRFVVDSRLYFAQVGYGRELQEGGRLDQAAAAYRRALEYEFSGREAVEGLRSLDVFTPQPPPACAPQTVSAALAGLQPYIPTRGDFVRIEGRRFMLAGEPFIVHGVNYHPRDYPGQRFLSLMDVATIDIELDLMRASGLNVLRVALRHDDLFMCPGNGAVPSVAAFTRLDAFIRAAAARGFKLVLVLNDAPDLTAFPLYESPAHSDQQMTFIGERYRDEPAILAYDLRDRGDADYANGAFAREDVIGWLVRSAALMRRAAPNHLITAGWTREAEVTAPVVDFVSFHHYANVDALRQVIAILVDATRKPVLLAAVGYNSLDMDEIVQRQAFQRAFEAVERNELAGWVVWRAFDHPTAVLCVDPDCPEARSAQNHFGLWSVSYFPKLAVEAVEFATGVFVPED